MGVGDLIRERHASILRCWTERARVAAAARGLDTPAFQNIVPLYLSRLADAGDELGRNTGARRACIEDHVGSRLRQGFVLAEIVDELVTLGRCIEEACRSEDGARPPDLDRVFLELHLATGSITEMFTRHMLEDEQVEKRYLRLIQDVATDALHPGSISLRERLPAVLSLVRDAMGAQSAALLLYEAHSERLELACAVGRGQAEIEGAAAALGSQPTQEVTAALQRAGIRSVMEVRLPPRLALVGILYVGLTEQRPFTPREQWRLESLGQHLTVQLDAARLYADLRARVDALDVERALRDRFVAVLAHDLRGPLAAAKVSAQALVRHPEKLDERRELALRIDRNIDRTDRMVRDLLDVHRVRAGQRLPVKVEECDLVSVANEVVDELSATFGDRFVVVAPPRASGWWSADALRRALWNLAANAVKYGAADRPIEIGVVEDGDTVRTWVRNEGPPIPLADQRHLFEPFLRTRQAQGGEHAGWGLGLTLVHGCAEAHGGRVEVESKEGRGTTFMIVLPRDARPFQPSTAEPELDVTAPPVVH